MIKNRLTITEYVEAASRTLSDKGQQMNLAHGAIGICTEVGEIVEAFKGNWEQLNLVNVKEEIGDVFWYITIFLRELELNSEEYYKVVIHPKEIGDYKNNYMNELMILSTQLLDMTKRNIFYGKEYDREKVLDKLMVIGQQMNMLCVMYSFKMEDVFAVNIKKLYARYPEKFTESAAIFRDYSAEEKAMTSSIDTNTAQ